MLEGSTNRRTWVALDSHNPGAPFASRGQTATRTLAGSASYSSYRITLRGAANAAKLRIAEIVLLGSGFDSRTATAVAEYKRALDPTVGIHITQFGTSGNRVLREAFASRTADVIVMRYETDRPGGLTGTVALTSAQDAPTTADAAAGTLGFSGAMANQLKHAATLRIVNTDGNLGRGCQAAHCGRLDHDPDPGCAHQLQA